MAAEAGSPTVTRVVLCRHGEPEERVRGRVCGSVDVGLSLRGSRQAKVLADALAGLSPAAVYSSPQRRALETARTIAAKHALAPVALDALREIDFGELEGLTYKEVAERHPGLYAAWMEEPTRVRFPGGESYADVRGRAAGALGELLGRHRGTTFAVVAHGGVIRAVLAACLRMPDEAVFRLDQRYAAVNVVDWLEDTPIVRLVNADPGLFRSGRKRPSTRTYTRL